MLDFRIYVVISLGLKKCEPNKVIQSSDMLKANLRIQALTWKELTFTCCYFVDVLSVLSNLSHFFYRMRISHTVLCENLNPFQKQKIKNFKILFGCSLLLSILHPQNFSIKSIFVSILVTF